MSGYSLWLCPPASEAKQLRELMAALSAEHSTPSFSPHATLVSDKIVPASSLEQRLDAIVKGVHNWRAAKDRNLELRVREVVKRGLFYQCVLAELYKDQNLLDLHESLLRSFGADVGQAASYYPHVSIVYGDLTDEHKAAIIASMRSRGDAKPATQADGSPGESVAGITAFMPQEILVVKTDGPTSEWVICARVPLDGTADDAKSLVIDPAVPA